MEDECLVEEHRADKESEVERIRKAMGWVSDKRVFGLLQPSRTIGDYDLKHSPIPPPPLNRKEARKLRRSGKEDSRPPVLANAREVVIATPHTRSLSRPQAKLLLLGSDGLFDVIHPKEALLHVRNNQSSNLDLVASQLCRLARERNSKDDITCVIVKL